MTEKRYKDALIASVRAFELRQMQINTSDVPFVSMLCLETGATDAGHELISRWIRIIQLNPDNPKSPEALTILHYAMVRYCIAAQRPAWGYDSADYLLTETPDNPPAMLVRAYRLAGEGQRDEARADATEALSRLGATDTAMRALAHQIPDAPPAR